MEITKRDLYTLDLMVQYGVKPSLFAGDDYYESNLNFTMPNSDSPEFNLLRHFETLTDLVIETLGSVLPTEGTPNNEMTDEEKGLVQLLFEIEKPDNFPNLVSLN